MSDTKTFADFGVEASICEALAAGGITAPFPIQELTLPLALAGADIIGQARTGTGKTLGFGIPLLQRADTADDRVQALVIVPTRELCVQVADDLAQTGARKGVRVVAAYGGKAIDAQAEALARGAQIVVGTPGRLLDLVRRGRLHLSTAAALVLDEADEMLDLGFLPDVETLIEQTAQQRQTLLFSATMPSQVVALARRYMHKPTFLRADVEEVRIAPQTKQFFFSCHRMDKPAVLARILQSPERGLCVVFTRTKRMADMLAEELRGLGINATPIHSDLRQDARERALSRFRKGTIDVLVATEVAARGLDIDDVTHVVNYDCPDDEKMYLHRIGRTGRAGAAGVAITFALWNELARLDMIRRALDIDEPVHEVFSTSPILDELFDLPAREGRPPRAAPSKRAAEPQDERTPSATRNRSGRGRGTSVEPGPRERTGREPTRPATAPQPASRTRVRRRAGAPEPAPAPAGDANTDERRRTRVRKRGGRAAERPAPLEREAAATRRAARGERSAPARSDSTDGRSQSARDRSAPARSDSTDGRSQSARDRSRAGQPSSSRSRGDGAAAPHARRQQPNVDAAAARGTGKPALTRRLDIQHLP